MPGISRACAVLCASGVDSSDGSDVHWEVFVRSGTLSLIALWSRRGIPIIRVCAAHQMRGAAGEHPLSGTPGSRTFSRGEVRIAQGGRPRVHDHTAVHQPASRS